MAQAAIDITRIIGRAIVGGEAGTSGGKVSRADRKNQGAVETARARREIKAGSAVIGGAIALVVAMFVFEASGGGGGVKSQHIETLKPSDTSTLRAALFGAAPWAIECTGQGRSLLQEAAAEAMLPDVLRLGRIDCSGPMDGGASLLERFNLKAPSSPSASALVLQAGHGLASPRSAGHHTSVGSLVRHLKTWAAPKSPALVNSTIDLHRHCLSRSACLLLLTSGSAPLGARKALLKAVGSSRDIGVATLNRKTHAGSFTSQLPSTTRAVLLALRAGTAPLTAEARAFKGVVSSDNQVRRSLLPGARSIPSLVAPKG